MVVNRLRILLSITFVWMLCTPGYSSTPLEERVQQLLASNDTKAAIRLLEHSDLENRSTPDMMVVLGRLYRERGTIVARLKSQKTLERAKQLFPDEPNVRVELGLTYFAQTFYPDACNEFRACLELQPDNCRAMYKLGVSEYEHWKLRINARHDYARDAREWLRATVECDSTNVDAARRLTNIFYVTEKTAEADSSAKVFSGRFPKEWHFPMLMGAIVFERGEFAAADSFFTVGLALMDETERTAFTCLNRNTLGYDEIDFYERLNPTDQETMSRGFWIYSDPDPTTDLNERALEHVYRTFRADIFFSAAKPHVTWTQPQTRGWDTERGETSIKFGWPDIIHASQGHLRWEQWIYNPDSESPAEFTFVDDFMNGKYQIPSWSEKMVEIRYANRVTDYQPEWTALDGAMDVAAFREDEFTATVYTFVDVRADSLHATLAETPDGGFGEVFTSRVRMFRHDWQTEISDERLIDRSELAHMSAPGGMYYGYVQRYEVPFEQYHVAAVFEDSERLVHAQFRSHVDPSRFVGDGVRLSDIVLEREAGSGPAITRGEQVIRPNPWMAYGPGQKLRTYVEVYNVAIQSGASRYTLSYSIAEDSDESPTVWNRLGRIAKAISGRGDRPPIIVQRIERGGTTFDTAEPLAIDISALPEGRYVITIRVDDSISGRSAEVSEHFRKVGVSLADDR